MLDNVDKCPDTPPGVAVDAYGCTRKGSITLEGVNFEYNSARLVPESRSVLDTVATDLKKYPRLKIELQGHTDEQGLGQVQPDVVTAASRLGARVSGGPGVPATQLAARGYGEGQPVEDNTTDAGRAVNRRVVMFVLDNPAEVQVEGEGKVEEK